MLKRERCRIPVFFAMCIVITVSLCGCGRAQAYTFEMAESTAAEGKEAAAEEAAAEEALREDAAETDAEGNSVPGPQTIWVYVCGAVRVPGVYELPANARVYQALDAAGGPLEGAELRSLNQAALLSDGEQITVYTEEETAEGSAVPLPGTDPENGGTGSKKVNLNTAGREELMTLSGIGEARAQAIISYREAHGPFTAVEEVMNIEGIKEKAFSKIKDEIEV